MSKLKETSDKHSIPNLVHHITVASYIHSKQTPEQRRHRSASHVELCTDAWHHNMWKFDPKWYCSAKVTLLVISVAYVRQYPWFKDDTHSVSYHTAHMPLLEAILVHRGEFLPPGRDMFDLYWVIHSSRYTTLPQHFTLYNNQQVVAWMNSLMPSPGHFGAG